MSKIIVRISMGVPRSSQFTVDNVNEIEGKLKEWHGFSDFERTHFTKKGTLDAELASGWYYKEQE
jgi:hypothetical protein